MRRSITVVFADDLSSVNSVEITAETLEEQQELEIFGVRMVDLFKQIRTNEQGR